MKLNNLKIKFALVIPFDRQDDNGVVYSKEAVEKAIGSFEKQLPIVYRENKTNHDEVVVGNTIGETRSVLWDDECQICEIIINGVLYYGGADCVINEIKDDVVVDFDIVNLGISQ